MAEKVETVKINRNFVSPYPSVKIRQLEKDIEISLSQNRELMAKNHHLYVFAVQITTLYLDRIAHECGEDGELLRPEFFNPETEEIMRDLLESKQACDVPKAYELAMRIVGGDE